MKKPGKSLNPAFLIKIQTLKNLNPKTFVLSILSKRIDRRKENLAREKKQTKFPNAYAGLLFVQFKTENRIN
jgi:hypothetical protein